MSSNVNFVVDACPSPPRVESDNSDKELHDHDDQRENVPRGKSSSEEYFNKRKSKKNKNNGPVNLIKISNCNGLQIGPTVIINTGVNEVSSKKSKDVKMTEEIQKLFQSEKHLNREDLMFISSHMGIGWENVARALDYSDGQIYQFRTNFIQSGLKEVVYQILLDWTRTKPKEATIGKIGKLLWFTQQKELVKLLVKYI